MPLDTLMRRRTIPLLLLVSLVVTMAGGVTGAWNGTGPPESLSAFTKRVAEFRDQAASLRAWVIGHPPGARQANRTDVGAFLRDVRTRHDHEMGVQRAADLHEANNMDVPEWFRRARSAVARRAADAASRGTDYVINGGIRALNVLTGLNVSRVVPKGVERALENTIVSVVTRQDMKAVEAAGHVGPVRTCHGSRLCSWMVKRLSHRGAIALYASPERASAFVTLSNFTLWEGRRAPRLILAQLGVATTIWMGVPTSAVVEVGGLIRTPNPYPAFGHGSDFHFGAYLDFGVYPAPDITVTLVGRGRWLAPFGLRFLHVEDVQGSVTVTYAGVPGGFSFGARLWIGHRDARGDLSPETAIEVSAYAGMSTSLATPLWFIGSVSDVSLLRLWQVLTKRNATADAMALPPWITAPGRTGLSDVVVSFSPSEGGSMFKTIPGGFRLEATVRFLGVQAMATIAVETMWGMPTRLLLDLDLSATPQRLGPFLSICRSREQAHLGPKVYAEVWVLHLSASAYIEGYVSVLGISAHVVIAVNNRMAVFHLDGSLFGLVNAKLAVEATDIRSLSKANFLARADISIGYFERAFRDRLAKLVQPLRRAGKALADLFLRRRRCSKQAQVCQIVSKDEADTLGKDEIRALLASDPDADDLGKDLASNGDLAKGLALEGEQYLTLASIMAKFEIGAHHGIEFEAEVTLYRGRNREPFRLDVVVNLGDIVRTVKNIIKAACRWVGRKVAQGRQWIADKLSPAPSRKPSMFSWPFSKRKDGWQRLPDDDDDDGSDGGRGGVVKIDKQGRFKAP
ncbi:unnamed protein product (mitochondrion) [Plasmodiophora brassicae]|uniref:Uncharacterized protein n=2 Tax=Plasmodiophora brassicae TaxID=37360 RepID=A0A3P3Y4D4_PLABS|nr:unnamed protein product [Plasmodiophora brassicae]